MLNDFQMVKHSFNEPIIIFPISDGHYGALEHCSKEWADFCKTVEQTPNAYVILGGDLVNNNVRTCKFINPYDELVRPREQKHQMVEFLKPIKDKILCAVGGNHEARSIKDDDIDITYDIMAKLDIEDLYRPGMCFMKVSLGHRKDNTPIQSYTFAVTHGAGGGIYTGATVNRNERFGNVVEGLDCLIVGHTHKGTVTKPSKIVIDRKNDVVSMSHYTVISMVSWLNFGGYAMQKMLLPAHVTEPQKLKLHMNHAKRIEVIW
jgi:predicted phosphodiesterase